MNRPAYTIGTLVTDPAMYAEMRRSFEVRGFADDCEYLIVDNSVRNTMDAYDGLNDLLVRARGRYVILCHQDVFLVDDGRPELDRVIADLTERDPHWAVAGNAGCSAYRVQHTCITDRYDTVFRSPGLPKQVHSLDENFLVVRPETRVGFSRDVGGFHLYATDICIVADILGFTSYVIPFHLRHIGQGATGAAFAVSREAFIRKWSFALRDRPIQTPSTHAYLSGSRSSVRNAIVYKWLRFVATLRRSVAKAGTRFR